MQTTRVLLLDDDQDLREVFVDLMAGVGVAVETVASLDELQSVMSNGHGKFDLAILDINLGPDVPSGIDAYRWLKAHKFPGRVVFLTGHARSHPLVSEALRLGDARVYDKPISFEELRAIMQ
jgi:DNA-binding NtrC family response regulator